MEALWTTLCLLILSTSQVDASEPDGEAVGSLGSGPGSVKGSYFHNNVVYRANTYEGTAWIQSSSSNGFGLGEFDFRL
jgi:hypothetical protein